MSADHEPTIIELIDEFIERPPLMDALQAHYRALIRKAVLILILVSGTVFAVLWLLWTQLNALPFTIAGWTLFTLYGLFMLGWGRGWIKTVLEMRRLGI